MLNLDYSTPRVFLMSFGCAVFIIGWLVFFGTGVFIVERVDALQEVLTANNTELTKVYNELYSNIPENIKYLNALSLSCLILGAISFFSGVILWVSQTNSSKPLRLKSQRTRARIGWLSKIWDITDNIIFGEFLLIVSAFLFQLGLASLISKEPQFSSGKSLMLIGLSFLGAVIAGNMFRRLQKP